MMMAKLAVKNVIKMKRISLTKQSVLRVCLTQIYLKIFYYDYLTIASIFKVYLFKVESKKLKCISSV